MSSVFHVSRLAIPVAAATMALWLAGCGSSNGKTSGQSPTANRTTTGTATSTNSTHSLSEAQVHAARVRSIELYASCLRVRGFKLPPVNPHGGNLEILKTQGVNTSSRLFKAASAECLPGAEESFRKATR